MTFTHALATNNYGPAKFVVATSAANGTHTTLASALSVATSGDTIFLRDSVTENVTLIAGVNIVAWEGSGFTPTVSITGKLSFASAGVVTISGIRLTTNSDFFLAVTGSAASIVILENCYLNCLNNTGISFTSSSASSIINVEHCIGDLKTTGIAYFASSAAGNIAFYYCQLSNSGASLTNSTISAGPVTILYCTITNAITTSGTAAIALNYSSIDSSPQNIIALTVGGSGSNSSNFGYYLSGSASAISISQSLSLINSNISSSNTNAITGAGTLSYAAINFLASSSQINTTTQIILNSGPSVTFGSANTGATNTLTISNSSNTATSNANVLSTVGGGTAQDATFQSAVSGVTTWTWGVDNSDSDAFVIAQGTALGTNNIMRTSVAGEINYPLQPAFLAYLASSALNKTGDGTSYNIGTDALTEVFDQNGDFNTNGTFTAPVTGKYSLQYQVGITGTTICNAIIASMLTSNRSFSFVANFAASAGSVPAFIAAIMDMDAADTYTAAVQSFGEAAKTDDISTNTFMSGFLAC